MSEKNSVTQGIGIGFGIVIAMFLCGIISFCVSMLPFAAVISSARITNANITDSSTNTNIKPKQTSAIDCYSIVREWKQNAELVFSISKEGTLLMNSKNAKYQDALMKFLVAQNQLKSVEVPYCSTQATETHNNLKAGIELQISSARNMRDGYTETARQETESANRYINRATTLFQKIW
jgi:hypothetical protein